MRTTRAARGLQERRTEEDQAVRRVRRGSTRKAIAAEPAGAVGALERPAVAVGGARHEDHDAVRERDPPCAQPSPHDVRAVGADHVVDRRGWTASCGCAWAGCCGVRTRIVATPLTLGPGVGVAGVVPAVARGDVGHDGLTQAAARAGGRVTDRCERVGAHRPCLEGHRAAGRREGAGDAQVHR